MSIRKRGNSYQVIYRCPGEASPRTETYKSEDEALIRDMQIKLAKKNGTFEPPIKIAKGSVQTKREITVSDFLDEYVEVYGLKKWGNSYYSMSTGLMGNEYHDYDLVVSQLNGRPYEIRVIDKAFYKLITKNDFRPVVFHSLRHSSTSLKLKLSRGNIKAVQGDTGHAEARMVTDTYAHGFDADRKLIAHEMDTGFFAKEGTTSPNGSLDADMLCKLKAFIQSHPELLSELLKGTE